MPCSLLIAGMASWYLSGPVLPCPRMLDGSDRQNRGDPGGSQDRCPSALGCTQALWVSHPELVWDSLRPRRVRRNVVRDSRRGCGSARFPRDESCTARWSLRAVCSGAHPPRCFGGCARPGPPLLLCLQGSGSAGDCTRRADSWARPTEFEKTGCKGELTLGPRPREANFFNPTVTAPVIGIEALRPALAPSGVDRRSVGSHRRNSP